MGNSSCMICGGVCRSAGTLVSVACLEHGHGKRKKLFHALGLRRDVLGCWMSPSKQGRHFFNDELLPIGTSNCARLAERLLACRRFKFSGNLTRQLRILP